MPLNAAIRWEEEEEEEEGLFKVDTANEEDSERDHATGGRQGGRELIRVHRKLSRDQGA